MGALWNLMYQRLGNNMKLNYGTQLSPFPIVLSIGTLIKPTLREISDPSKGMSFEKLNYYEVLIKMTPEIFYTKIKGEEGRKYWNSLTETQKNNISLYHTVINDKRLLQTFVEIFNFFFLENVSFYEKSFILLDKDTQNTDDISQNDIHGVIVEDNFTEILDLIQQICCISDEEEIIDDSKFKNKRAKELYYKMKKAAKKERQNKKIDINFTLANIISAVSNKHPSLNFINIWDLTIFQLLDAFNRLQINTTYDINATRVSVWGDEKKTFDAALWYKNEYERE